MYVKPRAKAIKQARILNRMSQVELAKLVGLSYSMISRIEAGERGCSPKTAGKISDALAMPMNALFEIYNNDEEVA